ncbi:MAG: hypothetical protein F6K36_14280 [Symploca sp. SIO3C6]|uniref:O-antigen ligase domain-containing protein n=1 Tax=Symploca sp. SIO1C4 TaxID=2607765 RepID=A0A6B3NK89_9CYAN|nr:hypothetical protein [Symploca sp. SIO3C6]NER30011.1 hypothetical protein [Symploca sp. SIO1C4]NET06575.1 hypothetical protein [Symploca sp. SIO2B6]
MVKLKSKAKKKSKKGDSSSDAPALSLKEQLAIKRQAQKERQAVIQFVMTAAFIGGILGLIIGLVVEPKIGVILGAGISSILICNKYPKAGIWFFFIYMPFAGTITYGIGGGNSLLQLAKDAFYFPALFGLIQQCRSKKQPILVAKSLLPTLSIILGLSLVTLFLVNAPLEFLSCQDAGIRCKPGTPFFPFFQGVLGLKVLLGYVPLILCGYYLIDDKKKLLWLGRLCLIIAIICCSINIVQYWMLDTGICQGTRGATGDNLFKASIEARCLAGGAVLFSPSQGQIRLPGTFVSPWHWAWFLISNSALTFAAAFSDTSPLWRMGGLAGMALVFVSSVISGQRIALALVPVVTVTLLFLTGQVTNLKRFLPIGVGLGVILTIAVTTNPELVSERIESFQGRAEASPPQAFIEEQFKWAFHQKPGLIGKGLGRATNSTRILGPTKLVETFHPKLIYEIGPVGALAFVAFTTSITINTFKQFRSTTEKSIRSFGSSFWVFILIISFFPYWYPLDTDPVAVYYWFFTGVIFKLPEIDKQEQEKLLLAEEQDPQANKKKKRGRKSTSRNQGSSRTSRTAKSRNRRVARTAR